MTDVLESEVPDVALSGDESIREALAMIDQGLGDISERTIISSSEMADLLLDVRLVLSKGDAELAAN